MVFADRDRQPLPLPAALAERGPGGLPLRGLRQRQPPARGRAAQERDARAARRPGRLLRPRPDRIYLSYAEAVVGRGLHGPQVRPGRDPEAAARPTPTGATDDEAFKAAFGLDVAAFDKAWLADNGVAGADAVRSAAGARPGRCRRAGRAPAAAPSLRSAPAPSTADRGPPSTASATVGTQSDDWAARESPVYVLAGSLLVVGLIAARSRHSPRLPSHRRCRRSGRSALGRRPRLPPRAFQRSDRLSGRYGLTP